MQRASGAAQKKIDRLRDQLILPAETASRVAKARVEARQLIREIKDGKA